MKLLIVGFIALAMTFNLVCAGVEPLLPAEEIPDVATTTAASSTESVLPEKSSSTTEMAKVDAETSKTGQKINKLLDAEHEEVILLKFSQNNMIIFNTEQLDFSNYSFR